MSMPPELTELADAFMGWQKAESSLATAITKQRAARERYRLAKIALLDLEEDEKRI